MSRDLASMRYKIFIFDSYILYALIPAIFYPRPITFKILGVMAIAIFLMQWRFGTIRHFARWIKQYLVGNAKKIRPIYYDIEK